MWHIPFVDIKRKLGFHEVAAVNLAPSSVGTTAQGTLTAAKVFGTLAQLNIGSVVVAWGSLGTASGRIARPFLTRGNQGTFGTVNVRSVLRVGSVGSILGTLSGHRLFGSVGSFVRIAGGGLVKKVGIHVPGSFVGGTVKARYAVWPTTFGNLAYSIWAGIELRPGTATFRSGAGGTNQIAPGQDRFIVAFSNKSLGSTKVHVMLNSGPSAVGTMAPPGTVWALAVP